MLFSRGKKNNKKNPHDSELYIDMYFFFLTCFVFVLYKIGIVVDQLFTA